MNGNEGMAWQLEQAYRQGYNLGREYETCVEQIGLDADQRAILREIRRVWAKFPHGELGELIVNVADYIGPIAGHAYMLSDERLLGQLREWGHGPAASYPWAVEAKLDKTEKGVVD